MCGGVRLRLSLPIFDRINLPANIMIERDYKYKFMLNVLIESYILFFFVGRWGGDEAIAGNRCKRKQLVCLN